MKSRVRMLRVNCRSSVGSCLPHSLLSLAELAHSVLSDSKIFETA